MHAIFFLITYVSACFEAKMARIIRQRGRVFKNFWIVGE